MANQYQGVDQMLTNVAIGYKNDEYIAEKVFPSFGVKFQSGKHFIYDRGMFRPTDSKRAQGSNSNEVTMKVTTGLPYFCEDHALKQFVADEDRDNALTPEAPDISATENVREIHMVNREKELSAMLGDSAILTQYTTLSGTSQFNDFANSNPFDVIETGKQAVHNAIHVNPNTAIISKQVWDKLKNHPEFLERVKYSQKGVISPDLLASLIEVDQVLIGGAGYNAADEGQTDSMSYIWGKNMILAYVAPKVEPKVMTLGMTYTWKQMMVQKLRGTDEEDRKGEYVRVGDHYYDQNLVAADAAYLIKNAVA